MRPYSINGRGYIRVLRLVRTRSRAHAFGAASQWLFACAALSRFAGWCVQHVLPLVCGSALLKWSCTRTRSALGSNTVLHPPTARSNDSAPRPEVGLPPPGRTFAFALRADASCASSLPRGADQVGRLSLLHRVYGNQAVLRALDRSRPAAPSAWSGASSGASASVPEFGGSASVGHLLQRQPAKEEKKAEQPKQTKTPDGEDLGPTNSSKK